MSWGAAYQALLDECKREYEAELATGRTLPDATGLYPRRVFRHVPQKKAARGMHLPHHGTQKEYARYGCRCPDCTAANAAACRSYYHRRREEAA